MKTNKPYNDATFNSYYKAKHTLQTPYAATTQNREQLPINQSPYNQLQAWHQLRNLECELADQRKGTIT